ncbi:hypothetical protein N9V91_06415, partial [Acidimicrobiaceae bacterium]|nr:hypothetical protein [Acidimicrobiaceae bacterium]
GAATVVFLRDSGEQNVTGPLDGYTIIDKSAVVSGPMCAQVLGDQGAGRLNLYLNNKRLAVTGCREGEDMVWRWRPCINRLRRLTEEPA